MTDEKTSVERAECRHDWEAAQDVGPWDTCGKCGANRFEEARVYSLEQRLEAAEAKLQELRARVESAEKVVEAARAYRDWFGAPNPSASGQWQPLYVQLVDALSAQIRSDECAHTTERVAEP